MSDARVSLRLIGENRDYTPGEELSGEFFVDIANPNDIRAVEISVLWYTEGKGDEDLAVHFFQRTTNDDSNYIDLRTTQHFETTLPNTPLSYDGVLLRIRWCVRVRAFLPRGRELIAEEAFRLGIIPKATIAGTAEAAEQDADSPDWDGSTSEDIAAKDKAAAPSDTTKSTDTEKSS